jgi:predicted nucleotidyltransferase component of viral defense system
MRDDIKNIDISVKARLKNIARNQGKTFNLILQLYMQERLLYRLSISRYNKNFILKGGLLLFSMSGFKGRPTRDIDFLALEISNDMENIKRVFKKICSIEFEDGIKFDSNNISVELIMKRADYRGIRLRIIGYLGKAKEMLWVDVGFNDVALPGIIKANYPVLLEMDYPRVNIYSLEFVVAEKFEAIISLGELNSRMKDFYDIYILLSAKKLNKDLLKEAIESTFKQRGTDIKKVNQVFNNEFIINNNRINQWKLFLKKIGHQNIEFEYIMNTIEKIMLPICKNIIRQ